MIKKFKENFSRDNRLRRIYTLLIDLILLASRRRLIREMLLKLLTPVVRKSISLSQTQVFNKRILADKTDMMMAVIYSAMRARVNKKTVKILMKNIFLNYKRKQKEFNFSERYGFAPPSFITISPGKQCNLKCLYCYANATTDEEKLSYEVFSRIIGEAKNEWGTHFFVISGGEPFLWKDKGYTLLDVAQQYNDCLFLVYTNGTLLKEKILERLIRLRNILPAISVEGMEDATDRRRGRGIFKRIVEVMKALNKNGVAFGISVTATSQNYKEVLSDEFIDFYFKRFGASFGWIFHYMPIGRQPRPSLMPGPEERLWMWHRTWEIIRKDKVLLADFWNHGTVSSGCISAARPGGYFYIDWNGNITPCVFFPYSTMNINKIYQSGKTLNVIFEDPFFSAIRRWQESYGYQSSRVDSESDWLRPCPIRDHHQIARQLIEKYQAKLIDGNDPVINSSEYRNELYSFDKKLKMQVGSFWRKEYIENG